MNCDCGHRLARGDVPFISDGKRMCSWECVKAYRRSRQDAAIDEPNGYRIREAREARGLSIEELAERIGCSVRRFKRIESKADVLDEDEFARLCLVLELPPKFFKRGDPPKFPLGSLAWH